MRLRTTIDGPTAMNTAAMWDFAMVSLQWAETAATTIQFTSASSNGAESVTSVNIPISLNAAYSQNITVDYAVTGGTASGGGTDYTLASGTATITAGSTSTNIPVTIVDDALDETDETIQITLSNPTNASLGSNTVHTYTITDNDAAPSLSINDVAVAETESAVSATFTISLSAASGQNVSVNLATNNNTATAGSDYTATSSTFTIPAGSTSVDAVVTVLGDALDEANETFNVALSDASNATISDATGVGTITDNDAAPSLSINDRSIPEANDFNMYLVFTITLSTVSGRNVSVDLATSDGTATAGSDYTATSSTFTIPAGSTTVRATTTVLADTSAETNETFNVNLTNPVNAAIADERGVGTIVDEDNASAQTASTTSPFDFGSGGAFTFRNQDNSRIGFDFPPNFYTENLRLRAHSFQNNFLTSSKPPPSGKNFVGKTYDFGLLTESGTEITNTSASISITMDYLDADVSAFTESTLAPYRWGSGDSSWQSISGSTLDTVNNTVTFSTAAFSSFAIMGAPVPAAETAPVASTGGGGGCVPLASCNPPLPPPQGFGVSINGDALITDSHEVVLTLRGGPDAALMSISNRPDFSDAVLEPYTTTKFWTLSGGEGVKTVYVKFYTKYRYSSSTFEDRIVYTLKPLAELPPERLTELLRPVAPQAITRERLWEIGALLVPGLAPFKELPEVLKRLVPEFLPLERRPEILKLLLSKLLVPK
ncbi:MAG: hypothetical protein HYT40_03670, partial [Candidatus Sungbacteria bacterium]|nr:hypothetical protein [Candidatus Sungbacteria bacterium]